MQEPGTSSSTSLRKRSAAASTCTIPAEVPRKDSTSEQNCQSVESSSVKESSSVSVSIYMYVYINLYTR